MAAMRQVSYQWRLREVMAAAGLFNASDLEPLLAGRGITLSSVQVWRLVTQTPERLSLPVLAALCDIFDVTPAQLIATRAENVPARRAASGGKDGVTDLNALRLARATGTRLSVCAAASASRSTPNCQDSRSSAAPGHSLPAIQRSMSSQVLGRGYRQGQPRPPALSP